MYNESEKERERKEKRKERNRKYWSEHKTEIAIKRKRKRLLEKQAVKFAEDIKQDESLQELLVELLELDNEINSDTVVIDALRKYAEGVINGKTEKNSTK